MLSPGGIKKAKGEEENSYQRSIPMFDPAHKGLEETLSGETIEWIKIWHARYLEEKSFVSK